MDDVATRLAKEFAFPASAVPEIRWNLAFVASILCYLPERKTLREREREARQRLRADPNDKDARDELRSILAGRRSVVVDATRTEMVDGEPKYVRYETPNNKNRLSRDNVDHRVYAATYQLAALWETCHGSIPLYDGTGKAASREPNFPGMKPSRGLEFVSEVLRAAGAFPRDTKPRAIRHRLTRRKQEHERRGARTELS